MPANNSFHEFDPLALDGVGDNHGRLLVGYRRQLIQRIDNRSHIVPVYLYPVPAEGSPSVSVMLEAHRFAGHAGHQLVVLVNDADEIAQFIRARGIRRFPDFTFAGLAVAHHTEDAMSLLFLLGGKSHPDRHGKTLAERT